VRAMCRVLEVHASGFYAWLKNGLSRQATRRWRLTGLIKQSWLESGCVYGYRKIHHDLLSLGEPCAPNTVAKLMRGEGLRAQVGYKRRPGKYGTKPAIVAANRLQQDFNVEAPDTVWGEPARHWFEGRRTTSPISERTKAGCIWRPSSIYIRAKLSDGRCIPGCRRHSHWMLCWWPFGVASQQRKLLCIRIKVLSLPVMSDASFWLITIWKPVWAAVETVMITPWRRASSICLKQSASEGKLTKPAKKRGKTCSIISKYFTIQNAGMLTMGCCHPSNMRWQQNEVARCLQS